MKQSGSIFRSIGLAAAALLLPAISSASGGGDWTCLTGDGRACTPQELSDSVHFRQVLLLPTGFEEADRETFFREFAVMVDRMGSAPGPIYSNMYRDRLLYIAYFLPGGALNSPEATFGGAIAPHPVRGKALTLRQDDVFAALETIRQTDLPELEPLVAAVIFNSFEDVTANASPPSFLGRTTGTAKFTRHDLESAYIASHEIAHGALNFLDEYIESGFQEVNIRLLDHLVSAALFNGTWAQFWRGAGSLSGVYDYNISEILAGNGNDNIDVTRFPSRVRTEGYEANEYEHQGGMFFGKGTFHDTGNNLMNSCRFQDGPGDCFGYGHSASQLGVITQIFEHPHQASRPNDRIRNAGPVSKWNLEWGKRTRLLMYDGDKYHRWHPTRAYDVQLGWYDREWKTCKKWGWFPYPCMEQVWRTYEKRIHPVARSLDLKTSRLYGLANTVQKLMCFLGIGEIKSGPETFDLCTLTLEEMTNAFLPTLKFPMPYEETEIPLDQWMTRYYWRFRTDNGTTASGWTTWAMFKRAF